MTWAHEFHRGQSARLLEDPSFPVRTLSGFNQLCDATIDITGLSTDQIVEKVLFEIKDDEIF